MAIRGVTPLTFRAFSVCDAVDATNVSPGAMSSLKDLVSNPANQSQFVPRPASTQLSNFAGFTAPAQGEALIVIGTRAYGLIASGRFAGKSEPFCYDLVGGAFITIAGVTAANCPASQATSGDWTPPTLAMIANRLIITHPGYAGVSQLIGWIDLRNFTASTWTGTTATGSPTITATSVNPLISGAQVGDLVTGVGIAANSYIVSMTTTSITLSQNCTANGTPTLTVASGTTAAPLYGAGNTNGTGLVALPTAVCNFNNRAYFAVNNGVQFSDSLIPTQITNASQALTLGDNVAVNALGGLPLSNQVVGGVLQSLIAFKGDNGYWQITGDQATTDLKTNFVNGSVGTMAPNSLCGTPEGLAYIAPDGLRIIGLDGKSSDPIGANGAGVSLPFQYAVGPSRICAAYNEGMIRVSVQNGYKNGQPTEEYWFDMSQKTWTGPHSFPAGLIEAYAAQSRAFVLFATGVTGKLWQSTTSPSAASTYTENGVALSFQWTTSLLPDNQSGNANQVVQSALGLSMPSGQVLTIAVNDEAGNALDTLSINGNVLANNLWGAFNWGAGTWGPPLTPYQEYTLKWHQPLVFKQATVSVTGPSVGGFVIGNLYAQVQTLRYQGAHG